MFCVVVCTCVVVQSFLALFAVLASVAVRASSVQAELDWVGGGWWCAVGVGAGGGWWGGGVKQDGFYVLRNLMWLGYVGEPEGRI